MTTGMWDADLIRSLRVEIISAAQQTGISVKTAIDISDRVEARLSNHLLREQLWQGKATRDAIIREQWTGRNLAELMCEFRLSRASIYRIVGLRKR